MKQKTFNMILFKNSKNSICPDRAWEVYINCCKLTKDSNKNTMEYLEKIGSMSRTEKLQWRTKLSEIGIELTPDQVEDYIFILSLAILNSWKII